MDNTAEYLEDLHHRVVEVLRSHDLFLTARDLELSKPEDDRQDDRELLDSCAGSLVTMLLDNVRESLQGHF